MRLLTHRRSRRVLGRLALGGLFALPLAAAGGCTGRGLADACTDLRLNLQAEKAAVAGWHRRADCYDDLGHPLAFKHGFKDGYLDAAHGGAGTAPAVPPKCYWDCHGDACARTEKVNAYYQGFAHGYMAAGRDGVLGMSQIPFKCPCEEYANRGGTYCPPPGVLNDLPAPPAVMPPPPAPLPVDGPLDLDDATPPPVEPAVPDPGDPAGPPTPPYEPTVRTGPAVEGGAVEGGAFEGIAIGEPPPPARVAELPADGPFARPIADGDSRADRPADAGPGVPFTADELDPADEPAPADDGAPAVEPVWDWAGVEEVAAGPAPPEPAAPAPEPAGPPAPAPELPGRSSVTLEPFVPPVTPPAAEFDPFDDFGTAPEPAPRPAAEPGRARLDLALELFAGESDAAPAEVPPADAPPAGAPAFAPPTLP